MKKIIIHLLLIGTCSIASATSVTFNASTANNIAGVGGADLGGSDDVEVGTWDGSTFSVISSGSNNNIATGSGFFSHVTDPFASTAGAQLAFRWTEALSGQTGIIYYDITAGGSKATEWTLKSGDGSGSDFNSNIIDVADLTTGSGAGYAVLEAGAVLINVEFSGLNLAGAPSFNLQAVPEPSAYSAIAGLLALSWVMVRRRA